MFVSKRIRIAVGIVVFLSAISLFYVTRTKFDLKPIKIYKAVYPERSPTAAKVDRSDAGVFQTDTASHAPDTQNFRNTEAYNDDPFDEISEDEMLYLYILHCPY